MPKVNTFNYDTIASWNGSEDLFVVEQPDGTKVATPEQIKQYVLNDMDNVPTQNSNNPVKSGGIFSAIDDVYSVMGEMGAKNLYNSQYSVPRTNAGTTATLGDDGHVIMNGTANADAAQLTRPGTTIKPIKDLKVGDKLILSYKVISGTFTHGSSSAATTLYFNNKNGSAVDHIKFPSSLSAGDSDSKEITLTDVCFTDGILDLKDIQIYMRSGDTFNNLELAIMLRLASDTDDTYQPYAKTNRQLTEAIGDLSQTGLTGDSVSAQLANFSSFLSFTHFVQIPFTTGVLDSIKAAFEDGTIPVDLYGITLGMVRGGAGSQRVIFIAQNQSLSTSQTRFAAVYFGAYTAPRFCQKQDGTAWTDVAL